MPKNIIITGVCGFIGFSYAKYFLDSKKYNVIGLDNFDNYYSVKLKKKRLNELKKRKNFKFFEKDINDKNINKTFKNKIDFFFHFAAQAGVRYSAINPNKYIVTNVAGFTNILNVLKKKKIKKIFYASSSSVYDLKNSFPFKEDGNLKPKSLYGLTKKFKEDVAEFYFKKYRMQLIGLRFFTVYGEWGRPDMFLFKLFKSICKNSKLTLHNYGENFRDFTHIDDAINLSTKLMFKKLKKHEIFNICSSKPIKINSIIDNFNKLKKIKIKNTGYNDFDMKKTHGSNKKITNMTKIKLKRNFFESSLKIFEWYKKNKIYNLD